METDVTVSYLVILICSHVEAGTVSVCLFIFNIAERLRINNDAENPYSTKCECIICLCPNNTGRVLPRSIGTLTNFLGMDQMPIYEINIKEVKKEEEYTIFAIMYPSLSMI